MSELQRYSTDRSHFEKREVGDRDGWGQALGRKTQALGEERAAGQHFYLALTLGQAEILKVKTSRNVKGKILFPKFPGASSGI